MGFFENRRAKKLAEKKEIAAYEQKMKDDALAKKQAKIALKQKKKDERLAKKQRKNNKIEPVKIEPVKVEPVKVESIKTEPAKIEPKSEPVKVESKTEPIKATPIKAEPKVEPAKVQPVKKEVVVEKKVEAQEQEEAKKDAKPAKYHVSQNKDPRSDNHRNWRVRKEGSNKTIKYFNTQKEAIEYADVLAETAGSSVVIHKLDGSIRKQSYTKKA